MSALLAKFHAAIIGGLLIVLLVGGIATGLKVMGLKVKINGLEGQIVTLTRERNEARANYAQCQINNGILNTTIREQNAEIEKLGEAARAAGLRALKADEVSKLLRKRLDARLATLPPPRPGPNTLALCEAADGVLKNFGRDNP